MTTRPDEALPFPTDSGTLSDLGQESRPIPAYETAIIIFDNSLQKLTKHEDLAMRVLRECVALPSLRRLEQIANPPSTAMAIAEIKKNSLGFDDAIANLRFPWTYAYALEITQVNNELAKTLLYMREHGTTDEELKELISTRFVALRNIVAKVHEQNDEAILQVARGTNLVAYQQQPVEGQLKDMKEFFSHIVDEQDENFLSSRIEKLRVLLYLVRTSDLVDTCALILVAIEEVLRGDVMRALDSERQD